MHSLLGSALLRQFMGTEWSTDNLVFVEVVKEYRLRFHPSTVPYVGDALQRNEECRRAAIKIYNKYLSTESKNEITFQGLLRAPIARALGITSNNNNKTFNSSMITPRADADNKLTATLTHLSASAPIIASIPASIQPVCTPIEGATSVASASPIQSSPRTLASGSSASSPPIPPVDSHLFDAVFDVVLSTVCVDVWPRFLRSKLSQDVLSVMRDRWKVMQPLFANANANQTDVPLTSHLNADGVLSRPQRDVHAMLKAAQLPPFVLNSALHARRRSINSPQLTGRRLQQSRGDGSASSTTPRMPLTARSLASSITGLELQRVCSKYSVPVPTFDDLLGPEYFPSFVKFCTAEHSDENILLLQAVETFKSHFKPDQAQEAAVQLYNQFVAVGSTLQVQMPVQMRDTIQSALAFPHPQLFDAAQECVKAVAREDCGRRFLTSEAILSHIRTKAAAQTQQQQQSSA